MKAVEVFEAYERLVERALDALEAADRRGFYRRDDYEKADHLWLTIDGGEAFLSRHHDWSESAPLTCTFPSHVLDMSDADFLTWKALKIAETEREEAERESRRAAQTSAHERREYERLKAKYEGFLTNKNARANQ